MSSLEAASNRRDRPWLLPYNRKLRHLHGITIRNLILRPKTGRRRGQTVDDEALPSSLQSPTKSLAHRETKKLEHSRSSSDLKVGTEASPSRGKEKENRNKRPLSARLRRRSTIEWHGASPLARQKKLEDVTGSRMADTFFSLHVPGLEEPIYVSETVEKAMNPNFRFFDLGPCGPGVTRSEDLTVKVWTKTERMETFQFLIELNMSLRSLLFIGKSLEHFRHPLPPNCILFHMTDGIYTTFTDVPTSETLNASSPMVRQPSGQTQVLPTASYDALMRLCTLDACIQDALATREKLEAQITAILEENKRPLSVVNQVPESQESAKSVETAATTQRKRLDVARRKRDELKNNIQRRKDAIKGGREIQKQAEGNLKSAMPSLRKSQEAVQQTADEIAGQRRRVCEDLSKIYPIEPIPNRSLAFTIRGIHLPNSDFDDVNEQSTAAALGHVAHVVYMLSFYLSVPLPYPIKARSSTSSIDDPISMTTGSRTYPLFLKGAVRFRFEYGVFLLNKDIEIISSHLGLRIPDIRQTLPNLKYLLYIATAGKGELPARKAGGIRAFMRGRETPTAMSRTNSTESNASSVADGAVKGSLDARIRGVGELKKELPGLRSNGKLALAKTNLPRGAVMQTSKLRDVS